MNFPTEPYTFADWLSWVADGSDWGDMKYEDARNVFDYICAMGWYEPVSYDTEQDCFLYRRIPQSERSRKPLIAIVRLPKEAE